MRHWKRGLCVAMLFLFTSGCPGGFDSGIALSDGTIVVSPAELRFGPDEWTKQLTVLSLSGRETTVSIDSPDGWISVSPQGGTATEAGLAVSVTVSRDGQPDGVVEGRVRVLAGGGDPVSVKVAVETVVPGLDFEREPNNTRAQANDLRPPRSMRGAVGASNDPEDWFRLSLTTNALVSVVVTNRSPEARGPVDLAGIVWDVGPGLNQRLVVLNSLTQPLVLPGQEMRLPRMAMSAGNSWIILGGRGGEVVDYEIGLDISTVTVEDHGEPNNLQGQAATWEPCTEVSATVGFSGDASDWYRVSGGASAVRRVRVRNTLPSDIGNGAIPVRVLDAGSRTVGGTTLQPGEYWDSPPMQMGGATGGYVEIRAPGNNASTYSISCA